MTRSRRNGRNTSALSHAFRVLKESLDIPLLNRTTRSVSQTEAAECLLNRIKPVYRDIDDALEDLYIFRDTLAGILRINIAHSSTQIVVMLLVTAFLKRYPRTNVQVVVNNAFVDMV